MGKVKDLMLSEDEIEAAAIKSMENMGAPKDIYVQDYGWVMRDGELTEAGMVWFDENKDSLCPSTLEKLK